MAFPPEVVKKEELSQVNIQSEIEMETKRALEEGKQENIAWNIATGRVNKEFIKKIVLLEHPFYIYPAMSVAYYLTNEAKGPIIVSFSYLSVGM